MLRFNSGNETYSLAIGVAFAEKWATALITPPPSLAKKLGIAADTVVRMIGAVDDDALRGALATAKVCAVSPTLTGLRFVRRREE